MFGRKLVIYALVMCMAVILTTGCYNNPNSTVGQAGQAYFIIQDSAGRQVSLFSRPQRIVVLSTSFLDLLYAVDGNAVGRVSSKTASVPEAAAAVPEVGYVYNVSVEKILALQPDLVIGVQGMHEKLVPVLESSKIPVAILKYKTYDDTVETLKLFGQLAGTADKANTLIQSIQSAIDALTARLPDKTTKIAILHATAKSVTVELDNTIAGTAAKKLRLNNIASGSIPLEPAVDTVPYSFEKMVEADPDVIFIVTMGSQADIDKRMKADVESSPAWSSLRAVRGGQVHFLPSDLFLLNPGIRTPEAIAYMAKIVYPGVYNNGQ